MWSPRRRALLASAGAALASTPGCLGSISGGRAGVSVTNPRLRKLVVFDNGPWATVRPADDQFLVVDVSGFDDGTYQYPLGVEMESRRVQPDDPTPFRRTVVVPAGESPTDPEGLERHAAALPVPARPADDVSVVSLDGGGSVLDLPLDVLEALPRVPSFDLRAFEARVEGGRVSVTVRVHNDGDREGLWLGQLSTDASEDVSEVFGLRVPVGETVERTVDPSLPGLQYQGDVTLTLRATTEYEREVTLPERSPTPDSSGASKTGTSTADAATASPDADTAPTATPGDRPTRN